MVCVSRYNIPIVFVDPIPCTMDYWYYEFCVLHLVCAMGREREGYTNVCTCLYKCTTQHTVLTNRIVFRYPWFAVLHAGWRIVQVFQENSS